MSKAVTKEGIVVKIWGGVTVKGKEYMDDQISQLVGEDVTGWEYAGDIGDQGDILVIKNGVRRSFYGKKGLEKALKSLGG